jgi:hypothetical protein
VKKFVIATAVAAALTTRIGIADAASNDEIADIRSQLGALLQRVDKLEQENSALKTENESLKAQDDYLKAETRGLRKETATSATAINNLKGAEWASRVTVTGDLRYRYEYISDETANAAGVQSTADRYRDRIRGRLNVVGRPTDTISLGLGLTTTEGGDPRSSNQTLTGVFSRKSVDLDLAYFDWKFASWGNLIGGKMRQPFVKAGQSLFWDNDVNPEGLAFTFNRGMFFGSAYSFWLAEVSGAESTQTSDTMLYGGQLGARVPIGSSTLTLAAHYYDLQGGQGRSPFYVAPGSTLAAGNANGNTTCTPALCAVSVAVPTLAYDYEVVDVMAQLNLTLGKLPLQLWANGLQNQDPEELETAWAAGFLLGAAQNYRTWELGVNYHNVEKDAVFAQLFDSDFGGGVTDTKGWVVRGGFAPVRNWVLNATYFLNERNVDVANAAGARGVDYDRLQVDFNVRF